MATAVVEKFHITPEGPKPCSASERACKYGEHFTSQVEAQKHFEKTMEAANPLVPLKREAAAAPAKKARRKPEDFAPKEAGDKVWAGRLSESPEIEDLNEQLEAMDFEAVAEFVATPRGFEKVSAVVEARAAGTPHKSYLVERLSPYDKENKFPLSYDNYKTLKADLNKYRDTTAALVEALHASPSYKPVTEDYTEGTVGRTVEATSYEHSDIRWHQSRFNSIGGSDIGVLAVEDFVPEEEKKGYEKVALKRLEEGKLKMISEEDAKKSIHTSETSRAGALYRGTMWEDRIRDEFAKRHPELTVYKTKAQYQVPGQEWYKVNFDGVLAAKGGAPSGILEIKTGGDPKTWERGIPAAYRAQTLYYLNATGLKTAKVVVMLNDSDYREYDLSADDEVYPGSGVKMGEYINNRVLPWFEGIKSQRE